MRSYLDVVLSQRQWCVGKSWVERRTSSGFGSARHYIKLRLLKHT